MNRSCDNGRNAFVNAPLPYFNTHRFRVGERVLLNGKLGTITDIFPDGIHMVKLDESGTIIAAAAHQLQPAPPGSMLAPGSFLRQIA